VKFKDFKELKKLKKIEEIQEIQENQGIEENPRKSWELRSIEEIEDTYVI
jgi:hypothetical protein